MIPYLDLKAINLLNREQLLHAMDEVLHSGWYVLGEKVSKFEQEYASFSGSKYCIGVANGLDALILSLKALGIGKGDEVIVPSNTYIASWLAVSYVGATPVPVEPREETCNINPELIEVKISPRTKAIMPVNLYGQAAELESICDIARRHQLFVVEDNAQAQGALHLNKAAGAWGDINGTSFYPGKNLGALGDAGAITTDHHALDKSVRILRNYGSERKYYNEIKGVNSRLDELQAAFLLVKMKQLSMENTERNRLANIYNQYFEQVEEVRCNTLAKHSTSVYHIYLIRSPRRDELQAYLSKNGVGTMIHYPVPPHLQKAYADAGFKKGDFPIAEEIADTCLSLPLYPGMSDTDVLQVAELTASFFRQ